MKNKKWYKEYRNRIAIIFLLTITLTILWAITASAYICQDETDPDNIPCEAITPIISFSGTCNATIRDLNNTSTNYTINITSKGDGTYNFTFNYSKISSYQIKLNCVNATTQINILRTDTDYNNKWLYFYGISLIIAAILLIYGIKSEDNYMTILSGFILIAFGLVFSSVGYPGLNNNTINISIILIMIAIGSFISLKSALEIVEVNL